ncbi:MAG: hypothetical protein U1E65_26105 [Myxococcota bacterium]
MLTPRSLLTTLPLLALLGAAPAAHAMRPVGLGAAVGVALPDGPGNLKIDPALSWGFFTDIPLVSTFHITPSTTLYHLDSANGAVGATDLSLSFKFIVPLGPVEPFIGLTGGVTSTNKYQPHFGGLVGLSVNILSNIDIYASLNYRLIVSDTGNTSAWHVFAGPLFRFSGA